MFFYGLFGGSQEIDCMQGRSTADGNTCVQVRSAESQAVRAGMAAGVVLGGLVVWLLKRKG